MLTMGRLRMTMDATSTESIRIFHKQQACTQSKDPAEGTERRIHLATKKLLMFIIFPGFERKQGLFDGVDTRAEVDGGNKPQAKTVPGASAKAR